MANLLGVNAPRIIYGGFSSGELVLGESLSEVLEAGADPDGVYEYKLSRIGSALTAQPVFVSRALLLQEG